MTALPADVLRQLYDELRSAVDDAISALGRRFDDLDAVAGDEFRQAERRVVRLVAEIVAVQDREARS